MKMFNDYLGRYENVQTRHAKANEASTACMVHPKPSVRASFAQRAFIPESVGSIAVVTYFTRRMLEMYKE